MSEPSDPTYGQIPFAKRKTDTNDDKDEDVDTIDADFDDIDLPVVVSFFEFPIVVHQHLITDWFD
jgi:hypothetical protein